MHNSRVENNAAPKGASIGAVHTLEIILLYMDGGWMDGLILHYILFNAVCTITMHNISAYTVCLHTVSYFVITKIYICVCVCYI